MNDFNNKKPFLFHKGDIRYLTFTDVYREFTPMLRRYANGLKLNFGFSADVSIDDLIQDLSLGLYEAYIRYDINLPGAYFPGWAKYWILKQRKIKIDFINAYKRQSELNKLSIDFNEDAKYGVTSVPITILSTNQHSLKEIDYWEFKESIAPLKKQLKDELDQILFEKLINLDEISCSEIANKTGYTRQGVYVKVKKIKNVINNYIYDEIC